MAAQKRLLQKTKESNKIGHNMVEDVIRRHLALKEKLEWRGRRKSVRVRR